MHSQKILPKKTMDSKEIKERFIIESILLYGVLVFIIVFVPRALPTPFLWIAAPACHILIRKRSFEKFGITARYIHRDIIYLFLGFLFILLPFFSLYRLWMGKALTFIIPHDILSYSLFQIFYVGFPEEFFFRGYLQGGFRIWIPFKGEFLKRGCSIFLSSAFFAVAHVFASGSISRLDVFFPSIIFGIMREMSGSIISSSLFHGLCNIVWRLAQS